MPRRTVTGLKIASRGKSSTLRLMIAAICAAPMAVWLAPPAHADDSAIAAAKAITAKAIEEQRVFLNCSVLDPVDHAAMKKFWQLDIDEAARILIENPATRTYLPEFINETSISNLMMPNPSLQELISFCGRQGDWRMELARFNYTIMKFKFKAIAKTAQ